MKKTLFSVLLVSSSFAMGQSIEILPGDTTEGNIISNTSGGMPTIHFFKNGTLNTNKMILSHSPEYSNYGIQYSDSEDAFNFMGDGTSNLYITLRSEGSDTKVGLNTANPLDMFHVNEGNLRLVNNYPYTKYYKTNTVGKMGSVFYNSLNTYVGFIGYDNSDDVLRMTAGLSGDHLVVNSSGNIGIGLDSPSQKLNLRDGGLLIEDGTVDRVFIDENGLGSGGEITLFTSSGIETVAVRASDATNKAGEIKFFDPSSGAVTMELDGDWVSSGRSRIKVDELEITGGSDLAEYFDIANGESLEAGTLLSVKEDGTGTLEVSKCARDHKVVGVLSGANGVFPGLMLKQKGSKIVDGDFPVAISGRVYVKAEAEKRKIKPGDLLTTSEIAGHAMSIKNLRKSKGAVVGKALTGLEKGQGMVLVLLGNF